MTTTLYISNQELQIVVGGENAKEFSIAKYASMPLVSGMMAGGAIIEPEGIATSLDAFLNEQGVQRKNLQLVIDNDTALIRIMDVPIVNDKNMRLLIRNEMVEQSGGTGILLYDYTVLQPKLEGGGGKILACAVEKELITSYQTMFKNIGIKLDGINLAIAAAIRVTQAIPDLSEKTYILSILDNSKIFSLLFIDGNYHFSNRGILMEQRGTLASATEISRSLSSLIQFNATQRTGHQPLSNAYICGLRGEETDFLSDISASLSLETGLLPDIPNISGAFCQEETAHYSDYLYCVGNLLK